MITFVIALIIGSAPLKAQNTALQKAFAASYSYEYAGNLTKAVQELKNVYDETSYELNVRLGWLYYSLKNYSEAAAHYKKATILMPLSVEAKLGYILPLSALDQWDESISVYKDILKIDAYNSTVNYRMGSIYYYRKDYNAAKQYLDNALNLYPFDYDIVLLSAWNYLMLGKKEQARILFEKVLLLSPGDPSALDGLRY